jgi:hypothetical protein
LFDSNLQLSPTITELRKSWSFRHCLYLHILRKQTQRKSKEEPTFSLYLFFATSSRIFEFTRRIPANLLL